MEDLIKKILEMVIGEDFVLSEIQKWTLEKRKAIEEMCRIGQNRGNKRFMHTINRNLMRPKPRWLKVRGKKGKKNSKRSN